MASARSPASRWRVGPLRRRRRAAAWSARCRRPGRTPRGRTQATTTTA